MRGSPVLFFVVLIIFSLSNLMAQTNAQSGPEPILEGGFTPDNARWNDDNSLFIFQRGLYHEDLPDYGVVTQTLNWRTISAEYGTFIDTDIWPLQPFLTSSQIEAYSIATDGDQISFIFPSPNKRFIVYAANRPPDWDLYFPMGIADLQSGEHKVITDIVIHDLENFPWSYDVSWSDNSNAFIIRTSGYDQLPYYVSLEPDLENLTFLSLNRDGVTFQNETLRTPEAFDISSDGRKLLLADFTGTALQLILWDSETMANSKIIAEGDIKDASFISGDEGRIIFWNQSGANIYDLDTAEMETLIPADSILGKAGEVWISPDAERIAVYTIESPGPSRLYILDLDEEF